MRIIIENELEEDVYSEETREMMLEEDELSPEEDAFMRGYEDAG